MGRANKNELFEIPRQLLQDDFTYKDVIVADFIEAHEKIKYDRQETSYVHQARDLHTFCTEPLHYHLSDFKFQGVIEFAIFFFEKSD
jgi:hypothetical protein